MISSLVSVAGGDPRILVGAQDGDDAGVFSLDSGTTLVATADFITPVCDEPDRFGRVAAANSLSDIYAMGGSPLFALNLCCFPESGVPDGVLASILTGAAETLATARTSLIGGHTVRDPELKYGLAVVGTVNPERILRRRGAVPGDRLLLTKPLGTGVLINAFKLNKLDGTEFEPALREMERLNDTASTLAREHGVRAATDVTGFGLAGHALGMARDGQVRLRINFENLPIHEIFYSLAQSGVTTGCTSANRLETESAISEKTPLSSTQREVLFDPQTSGGLLLSVPAESSAGLLAALIAAGHRAADIGEVSDGSGLEIV